MVFSTYIVYDDTAWETTVAGIPFSYNNENRILLFKYPTDEERQAGIKGNLYELQMAYEMELLSLKDIQSIAYYHENKKAIGLLP